MMEETFKQIISEVGEDLKRDGLVDTPQRAAKAMAFLDSDTSEMVVVQDIELYSMCEHHMLPFIGKCHVA